MPPQILESLLEDILTHCMYIIDDTRDTTYDEFEANRQTRQVVERNLIVIGICAGRIRDHFPDTYSGIVMLRSAIDLRNRLAHGYEGDIDNRVIWRTVQVSIPKLVSEIAPLLSPEHPE